MTITTLTSLTSINYYSGSPVDNGTAKVDAAKPASHTNHIPLNDIDSRQDALAKLNNLLAQAYDKLSPGTKTSIEKYQENTPLTAEKVANNILGFIARRLQQDQAEGASAEQLQSRLDAGLAGFKKGFAEAEEQLKALALLSPAIKTDLATTHKLVLAGIDELQNQLTKGENLSTAASSSPLTKLHMNHLPVGVSLAAQLTQAYKFNEIDYNKAEARDFRFELTTKEGDKVSIHASASYGASISRQGYSLTGSYSESQSFSFVVEGDLSADELNSINNLLRKVNKLAEQFYANDFETAYVNAQKWDFDDQHINAFSLSVSQSQIEVVTQIEKTPVVIQDAEQLAAPVKIEHQHRLAKDFIETLLSALDTARLFNNPEKLLLDIAKNIQLLKVDEYKSFPGFIENPKNFDGFVSRLININLQK